MLEVSRACCCGVRQMAMESTLEGWPSGLRHLSGIQTDSDEGSRRFESCPFRWLWYKRR